MVSYIVNGLKNHIDKFESDDVKYWTYGVLAFIVIAIPRYVQTTSESISMIVSVLTIIFTLNTFILPLVKLIFRAKSLKLTDYYDNAGDYARRVLAASIQFTILILFIKWVGPDIITELNDPANQDDALKTSVIIGCTIFITLYMSAINSTMQSNISAKGYAVSVRAVKRKTLLLTERDREMIAAHETGHALMYAAFGALPKEFKVVVRNTNEFPNNGYVHSGYANHDRIPTKAYVEWFMLNQIAGQRGELFKHNTGTLGGDDDLEKWQSAARSYLINHYDGVFYISPADQYEFNSNNTLLSRLKTTHEAMVDAFLELNTEPFNELYKALLTAKPKPKIFPDVDSNVMDREKFVPIMKKVRFPEGFPMPFGEFEEFSDDEFDIAKINGGKK